MSDYQCACLYCDDFILPDELVGELESARTIRNAIFEGFEPFRYCITCINKRCYEGRGH